LNAYAGQKLRLRVSLANEDVLTEGYYPARIAVSGPQGTVLSKDAGVKIQGGRNPPLAYLVLDEDVKIDDLVESEYTLSATLSGVPNAKADFVRFNITNPRNHPDLRGAGVTVLGISPALGRLLSDSGIMLHEYEREQHFEREVIVVGDGIKDDEAAWRELYDRIAAGGFAIFLSRKVLADNKGVNQWLAVEQKGNQTGGQGEPNIFRTDIVARDHPIFKGLPTGVLIPEIYGGLLRPKARFSGITVPEDVAAVWIQTTGKTAAGLVLGTYPYRKGRFLINSFDLMGNIGQPAADRLILNMVKYGQANSLPVH
jgi:hypothetical protein